MEDVNKDFLSLTKIVRFPLICMVLFIHSLPFKTNEIHLFDYSPINIFHFISELISHNFSEFSVCLFFLFSGFLFFYNVGFFNSDVCLSKWKKRFYSLLLPYLFWNTLAALAIFVVNTIYSYIGVTASEPFRGFTLNSVINWYTIPADFPLWYVRDLLLMTVLAPLVYLLLKKFHYVGLLILLAIYCSPWNPAIPNMKAIFYFSFGSYLSIWKVDILGICRKFKVPSHFLAVATLLLATFNNASAYHEWYLRLFYPFGMISFLNIFDSLSANVKIADRLAKLSSSVFFIYAAHEIYILGWTKGFYLRLFGESIPALYLRYFLVPITVLAVCLLLFNIFKKICPKTLDFVCGKR